MKDMCHKCEERYRAQRDDANADYAPRGQQIAAGLAEAGAGGPGSAMGMAEEPTSTPTPDDPGQFIVKRLIKARSRHRVSLAKVERALHLINQNPGALDAIELTELLRTITE